MKLGVKHVNQTKVARADFSGGLNTSMTLDGIAENQLSDALNVEIDSATRRLKTVAGTKEIFYFSDIFAAAYDEINEQLLLVKNDKRVYAAGLTTGRISPALGTLSGDLYPATTSWEDGLLIASGGKLQYYNGRTLNTIADSPNATCVYIRAGRVLVTDDNNVRYSGVGDETNWTEDTNDDSSSKFVEIGYKDGGKVIGMVNLSSDVLLIKDNRRLYRLNGEFPNWVISEVSRNVEVSGRLSYCSVSDSVFILGRNEVQNIQTTTAYGDMKPIDVATLITNQIQTLPANAMLRYVPPLSQIWAVSGRNALMFDLPTQSWYKRRFNSPVIDVIPIGDEVIIVKGDRVSRLSDDTFYDDGAPMQWRWQGQRLVSQNDYFLKRTQISVSPIGKLCKGEIRVGAVAIEIPVEEHLTSVVEGGRRKFLTIKGTDIFENHSEIFENPQPIFYGRTLIAESRNVYRNKFLDIGGHGSAGGVIFNWITLDVAEV